MVCQTHMKLPPDLRSCSSCFNRNTDCRLRCEIVIFTRKTSMIGYIFGTDQSIADISGAECSGNERARCCWWCCLNKWTMNVPTPKHTQAVAALDNEHTRCLWSHCSHSNGQRLFSQSHILTIFVLTVGCLEKGSRQKIIMATPPNPLDNHIDEVQTHKTV